MVGLWAGDMGIKEMTLEFGQMALMMSNQFSIPILIWLSVFPS